jgi:ankyrin repeat protein
MENANKAVLENDIEALRKLFSKTKKHKWRISYLTYHDQDGLTPMANAIKHNRIDHLTVLLEAYKEAKLDINTKDKNGYTILHLAVQSSEKVLMAILQCEGIDVNVQNADKNRPLHYFCQAYKSPNCSKPFKQLVDKGCEVNAQNKNGETALHKAIFNNSVRLLMVDLLLKNGADVNILNNKGESAIHYAVRLGRDDLVSVLLRHGADVSIVGTR